MKRSAAALAGLLLLLACGCSGGPSLPPLPDLSQLEAPVAASIEARSERVREEADSPVAWGELGMVLDAHRFHAEAAECYRRALELDPDSFEWSYHLAVVLDALDGEIEEVTALLDSAAGRRPGYAPLHCRHGEALARRGLVDEARREFERALAIDDRFAAAHRGLGQILLQGGEAEAAVRHLEAAARLAPRDRTTYAALAQARQLSGDTEGARAAASMARARMRKSMIPDPVRAEVHALNLSSANIASHARAAMAQGRHDEAIELFLRADAISPGSAGTQYSLGVCYLKTGRLDLAEHHLRRAIEISNDAEARWRLGLLLLDRGDAPGAREQLRGAAEQVHEGDPRLLVQIATGLARVGLPGDSLALFERAALLGGETAPLLNNWGIALLELERDEEALDRFREALALDPKLNDARLNAGTALERLGRNEEAVALYREALELDPDGPARARLERLAP